MSSKPATVVGGKLKFKGSSSSNKKDTKLSGEKRKVEEKEVPKEEVVVDVLTESERKIKEKKLRIEEMQIKKLAKQSYRERINTFNVKLSQMTEHNDIPRVSAAGNG